MRVAEAVASALGEWGGVRGECGVIALGGVRGECSVIALGGVRGECGVSALGGVRVAPGAVASAHQAAPGVAIGAGRGGRQGPEARTEPVSLPWVPRISQMTMCSPAAQAPWLG